MSVTSDLHILASELRRVRLSSPPTIGAAMHAYAKALRNARDKGADPAVLLAVGELVWMAIRPEAEPAPEKIAEALDEFWRKFEADIAFCTRGGRA